MNLSGEQQSLYDKHANSNMTTAKDIDKLRREIREHDRRYYVKAAPVISDLEYDRKHDAGEITPGWSKPLRLLSHERERL